MSFIATELDGAGDLTGDYNVVDVLGLAPHGKIVMDPLDVVDVQEQAFWPPKESREILDSIAFRWSVDNAKHLIKVVANELAVVSKLPSPSCSHPIGHQGCMSPVCMSHYASHSTAPANT